MKLASLKSTQSKDGELVVVSKDNKFFKRASQVSASLREAIENWASAEKPLKEIYERLNQGLEKEAEAIKSENIFHSALPRTWLFADGSAFIQHIKLVRKARNAALPETLQTVPLMYQGESGRFLAPTDPILQVDFKHGTDFEAEVGVIVDHVPMGITADQALDRVRLFVLINDVSLRGLIPEELAQGFGFFQSKPNSALSPFALTVDELGSNWKDGRIQLPLLVNYNNEFFGRCHAGEMHFHFGQLISHAARTRDLPAGTLIGSGTVANEDITKGSSCLAEKRTIEQINLGQPVTPFMKSGDTIEILMKDHAGHDLFGRIMQKVNSV